MDFTPTRGQKCKILKIARIGEHVKQQKCRYTAGESVHWFDVFGKKQKLALLK